jgi:hypothetical protein
LVVYAIPDLRPYATNKLDNRSKPCVFLEYSLTQSAYSCLDPSISKIYVSRHVRFVESVFPFTHISAHSSHPQSNSLATWIPSSLGFPRHFESHPRSWYYYSICHLQWKLNNNSPVKSNPY